MPLWPQVAQRRLVGARPKPVSSGQHGPKCQRRFAPYFHMLVSFEKDGVPQTGYISMKHLSSNDVVKCNLGTKFNIGETITAQISGYSDKHKNWYMRIKE